MTEFSAATESQDPPYLVVARLTPLARNLVIHCIPNGRLAIRHTKDHRRRQDGVLAGVVWTSAAIRLLSPAPDGVPDAGGRRLIECQATPIVSWSPVSPLPRN